MRRSALLSTFVLAISPAHAATTSRDEAQSAARAASEVVDTFHGALGRGDTREAAAQLADDALIYESGGVERGKVEYAAHHLAADAAFARMVKRSVTRREAHVDGNIAWIATEATTKGMYRTRPINSVGTETMVLRRTPAGWRIVHVHWSSANLK